MKDTIVLLKFSTIAIVLSILVNSYEVIAADNNTRMSDVPVVNDNPSDVPIVNNNASDVPVVNDDASDVPVVNDNAIDVPIVNNNAGHVPNELTAADKEPSKAALSDIFPNWFFNGFISWVVAIFACPVFFLIGFSFAYVFSLINKVIDIGLFQPIAFVAGVFGPLVCSGYLIADYFSLDMLGHIWAAIVSIPLIIGLVVILL